MSLEKIELDIKGLYLLENFWHFDNRGGFVKLYNRSDFENRSINIDIKELYYSYSQKDVIRGMHFQLPPYEVSKLVCVIQGSILDVVIDLRKNSPTYKMVASVEIKENRNSLLVPKGCAHGFRSLEDDTIVFYQQSDVHSKEHDSGILWDSFDFDWQVDKPILSDRDLSLTKLKDFQTPFNY